MSKKYVIKISAENGEISVEEIDMENNTLAQLQSMVGGYIEIIPLSDLRLCMVVDEDGKLKNKPVNLTATAIAGIGFMDCIVGDAVIVIRGLEDIVFFNHEEAKRCAALLKKGFRVFAFKDKY